MAIKGIIPKQTNANFHPIIKAIESPPTLITMALNIFAIFSPEASSIESVSLLTLEGSSSISNDSYHEASCLRMALKYSHL